MRGEIPLQLAHAFDIVIRLLELGGHPVKFIGEEFQFVSGSHFDSLAEFPAADARCGLLERPDRSYDVAGEQEAGGYRERKAESHEDGGAEKRFIYRAESLIQRQFDEHGPGQRFDPGVGGQDLPSLEIGGERHLIAGRAGAFLSAQPGARSIARTVAASKRKASSLRPAWA